jgi:Protein of unknown function (DUF2934)
LAIRATGSKSRKTKATVEETAEVPEVEPGQIALRAYEIYESEGGDPLENWLRAERELGVAPAMEAAAA